MRLLICVLGDRTASLDRFILARAKVVNRETGGRANPNWNGGWLAWLGMLDPALDNSSSLRRFSSALALDYADKISGYK